MSRDRAESENEWKRMRDHGPKGNERSRKDELAHPRRDQPAARALKTYGIRQDEAQAQIRELRSKY